MGIDVKRLVQNHVEMGPLVFAEVLGDNDALWEVHDALRSCLESIEPEQVQRSLLVHEAYIQTVRLQGIQRMQAAIRGKYQLIDGRGLRWSVPRGTWVGCTPGAWHKWGTPRSNRACSVTCYGWRCYVRRLCHLPDWACQCVNPQVRDAGSIYYELRDRRQDLNEPRPGECYPDAYTPEAIAWRRKNTVFEEFPIKFATVKDWCASSTLEQWWTR